MAQPAPPVDDNFLQKVFQQVDKDRSNAINANELQACLSNGTWEPFNAETIKLMVTMFDKSNRGQLNYQEFKQLWKYIEDWRQCFQSFDKDKSGYISKDELKAALTTFGYQLSDSFYDLLMVKFVKGGQGAEELTPTHVIMMLFNKQMLYTLTGWACYNFLHENERRSPLLSVITTPTRMVITIKYEDFLKLLFSMR